MDQSKIDRINELTCLARERELTAQEQSERASLRREYVDAVKKSLTVQLENTYIVDKTGEKHKLPRKD